jgi:hypothetical protein
MSIKVVCGCGFATLLPSEWQGKRVRCKCGRTFVVGESGAILEPPAQAMGGDAAGALAELGMRSAVPEPAALRHAMPIPAPEEAASSAPAPVHVAETLHRERQVTRQRRRSVRACTALVTALALASALIYVLRLHDWSLAALLRSEPGAANAAGATSHAVESVTAAGRDQPAAKSAAKLDGTAARPVESTATRLANLMPLVSEDGLLLTGLFGDADQRVQLTDTQRQAIQTLVAQLQASEEPLRSKSLPMDQWYADMRRLGDQLLAVLTDDQRQQLQILLEQGPVVRVQLVEYAARILPELAVPQVPWSLPTDGGPFRDLAATPLARVTGQVCGRAPVPSGVLATRCDAAASDVRPGVMVWDMSAVEPLGRLETDPVDMMPPCVLSHGGTHVALTRGGGTARAVELWETASGRRIGSRELPGAADDAATVRACTDRAVVAITRRGCWVWKFPSDELLAFEFPEARPDIAPGLVVSPQGKYLFVAHRYLVGDAPDTKCFLEVCVYSLDSGELLGNQLLHHEYRSSTISAMVLSHDGRELALVWDFDRPEPARKLVHMHASSGKIIRIVDGLQPPVPADVALPPLPDRALICLPENSGWVVDLRQVVDAETGAVLALDELAAAEAKGSAEAPREVWVDVIPTSDGRLRVVTARPEDASTDAWTLQTRWINLPKLGPFR